MALRSVVYAFLFSRFWITSIIIWTYLDRVSEAARASCAAAELKLRSPGRAYHICCSMFFSRTEIGLPLVHIVGIRLDIFFVRATHGRHFSSQPAVTKALAEAR